MSLPQDTMAAPWQTVLRHSLAPLPPAVRQLGELYRAALTAADPRQVVPPHLPPPPRGRTVVVGLGKAAAAMAQALESHWDGPLEGVVVVPEGAALPLRHIQLHESSHPVPDERSVAGAERLMAALRNLSADDLVIALVSGGGSALCAWPAPGLTLQDKQAITRQLLRDGASIADINTVRRHLSSFKGGRLAIAAHPAPVVTLAISDIPGDDPQLIASGPTLADASTCAQAQTILTRHGIQHAGVHQALASGAWESPKPGDPRLAGHSHQVIASAWTGLAAAAQAAQAQGIACHILSDAMEGEARELGLAHAGMATSILRHGAPFQAPCVLLSGGEATVTVRGDGRGGRNTEFVLATAMALDAQCPGHRIHILSAGTDGLDGHSGAAGAWAGPDTLGHARARGLHPRDSLDRNDSATLLGALGCLLHTGPTHTNINDFRALLIEPGAA